MKVLATSLTRQKEPLVSLPKVLDSIRHRPFNYFNPAELLS